MRKKQLILLAIFVSSIVISVILFNQWSSVVKATNPKIGKRDIPHYGILITASSDYSFNEEVMHWTQGRTDIFNGNAKSLLPFSFFVKNMSNKDILAYKLRWKLRNSDGTVTSYVRSYFQPDSMMGIPKQTGSNSVDM